MSAKKSKPVVKTGIERKVSFFKENLYRVIIFCFGFLLYANTIPHQYNLDDELVTRNHRLTSQGVKAIPEIFTSPYYSDNSGYAFEYRPLVHVSFALEHQVFGESPHVSHFMNALLYAGMCLLLFSVLLLLVRGENIFFPFLVTLLFAAHPVHTEVVASIKNRDEMLALIFSLTSWYVIMRYAERKFWWSLIGGAGFFSMALLSKVSIFGFIVVIPFSLLFFYRLPFYKSIVVVMALFLPAFLLINLVTVESKLLLLAIMVIVLYLSNVLKLLLPWIKKENNNRFTLIINWKIFLTEKIFPFNHPLLFPGLCIAAMLFLAGSIFVFAASGDFRGVLLMTGLCFLLSLRAEKTIKWLLLLFFELALWLIYYLINEQFIFIIFLTWCHFSFLYWKVQARKEKLVFACLLAVSAPFVYMNPASGFQSGFLLILISLIPLLYTTVKKLGALAFNIIVLILVLGVAGSLLDSFFDNIYISYLDFAQEIFLLYLLLAFYPEKLRVKENWVSAVFISLYFTFCFIIPYEPNYSPEQNKVLKSILVQNSLLTKEKSSDFGEKQSTYKSDSVIPEESPKSLLEGIIGKTVDRPLDFVESPVRYTDPITMKIASGFDVMLRYLRLLVIPYPMSFYYGYKEIQPVAFSDAKVVSSIIIHFLLLLLALYFLWKGNLIPFFSILIYFCAIIPFTNIYQAVPGMMGDRYLLGPSIGFCMLIAWGIVKFCKIGAISGLSQIPKTAKYVILLLLSVYALLTVARNTDWKDDFTLFTTDIKHVEQSSQAHNLLALNLRNNALELKDNQEQQKKLMDESVSHFKKSLEIYPQFFNVSYNLALTYMMMEIPDSALVYYQHALTIDSDYAEIHFRMGEILFAKGRLSDAEFRWQKMIEKRPLDYRGYDKLSYLYFSLGQFDKSIEVNRAAIAKMPGLINPVVNLGRTYLGINQRDSARVYFEQAFLIDPNNQLVKQLLQQTEQK